MTAIEWLLEEWPILESQIPARIIDQAKQMEKEQMIKFANDYIDDDEDLTAEEYYNETYNN